MKNELRPTMRVIIPSIRKSQRQPAHPATPRMCRRAKASSEVMIVVAESVVQKKLYRRSVGSFLNSMSWNCIPEAGRQFS